MYLHYKFHLNKNGSYSFLTDQGHSYSLYFFESTLPDTHNNTHIIYNLGFSRNDRHEISPFSFKYDERIKATAIFILTDFFNKNDHRTLIYSVLAMTAIQGTEKSYLINGLKALASHLKNMTA